MQRNVERIVKGFRGSHERIDQAILRLFVGKIFRKESVLQSLPEQLGDISNFEPPHQIESMHLDCSDADREPAGDVAIGIALRHQFQNFLLSRRQAL